MMNRAAIISALKKDLQTLQGLHRVHNHALDEALWFFKAAFPAGQFPLGCVHEFQAFTAEDMAASRGFISSILSHLLQDKNMAVWISRQQDHCPPALPAFSISPDRFLFVRHHNEKELLWVAEEFLKYEQLTALVAEFSHLDFTASRRFQLAVEKSKVTAFVLRTDAGKITNNASVSRWQVKSIPSAKTGLPGVGFPAWEVALLKMRNGKPLTVSLEYRNGRLQLLQQAQTIVIASPEKATG
ncbi:MAG: Error-prone repair protein ImuA [Chitinophagaceae bacterium]|nr:MAG: Error-prone repair protein ImuA [Chitinophagaceae bacterium]